MQEKEKVILLINTTRLPLNVSTLELFPISSQNICDFIKWQCVITENNSVKQD